VPRLHEVRIALDGGTPTVHWQHNGVAQGVRIAYWIHSLESDPTGPATTVDVAASELGHTLGVTVQPGEAITVEVTPYTGWTGSAVSGTPGPSVERSVARPREPEGPPGPPGPPGASVEIRYSGPNPGQNISGAFNPMLHLYMQVRREGESWPSQWARIVGEDGEPGADGTYVDYRFRASAEKPDTP